MKLIAAITGRNDDRAGDDRGRDDDRRGGDDH
jgi:hypothetical protein